MALSENIQAQIEKFKRGSGRVRLHAPCTLGSGVRVLSEKEIDAHIPRFERVRAEGRVLKFVPASGAATRMFRALKNFLQTGSSDKEGSVEEFFKNIDRFAFAGELWDHCRNKGLNRKELTGLEGQKILLHELLDREGMNYENFPKGLIPFHTYPDHPRTAFEEHLVEALQYARDKRGVAQLHFTVSGPWLEPLKKWFQGVVERYETQGEKLHIEFSVQKPGTDTLAVDFENTPIRLEGGSFLFRPGGHGALLENLNECGGDIVFIKNIDNVTHDHRKPITTRYKKALGGLLVEIQGRIFSYLRDLETGPLPPQQIDEIRHFAEEELCFRYTSEISQKSLITFLNRPLRVCGVVQNQGEPGGAPFWVLDETGGKSLQIVESSQVDRTDPKQWEIFRSSVYFNPVDLVCGLRGHRGQPFNLTAFRDENMFFISEKTHEGRALKALELPGLWNGGMAFWNTVFVEVPLEIFAPVKEVNDLLRPVHQP